MARFLATTTAILIALVVAVALIVFAPAGAAGQPPAATLSTYVSLIDEPGSTHEVGRIPIDAPFVGPQCTWTVTVRNQWSPHRDNTLLIRSGTEVVAIEGIEDEADGVTTQQGSLHLANEVVVSIRLGPEGKFSGRLEVVIDTSTCQPPETQPPTTTPSTTEPPIVEPTEPTTDTSTTATTGPPLGPTTEQPTTTTPSTPTTPSTQTTVVATTAPTTTATEAPSTVPPEPTTSEPPPLGPTLPVTGASTTTLLVYGSLALAAGLGVVGISRRVTPPR